MPMHYIEINKVIHTYFFEKYEKGDVLLFFEEADWTLIASKTRYRKEEFIQKLVSCLQEDWTCTTAYPSGVFQGFGLLALQTYAAYLMQKASDDSFTENAYNQQLCDLLKIEMSQLQRLFRGNHAPTTIQDEVWGNMNLYLAQNGYSLDIPLPSTGPGRFVQYPKSQALLNTEDLKVLTAWFYRINLRPHTPISVTAFCDLIRHRHLQFDSYLSSHGEAIFKKFTQKKQRIYRQIFNFYQKWDGTVYEPLKNSREIVEKDISETIETLLLLKERDVFKLFLKVGTNDELKQIVINDQLFKNLKNILNEIIHGKFLIFNELPFYEDEFEWSNMMEMDNRTVIITSMDSHHIFFYLNNINFITRKEYGNLVLFEFITTEEMKDSCLKKYFRFYPFKLEGGLKTNRKTWLEGCGPRLKGLTDCRGYINEHEFELKAGEMMSLEHYRADKYTIKIQDYSATQFYIEPYVNNCKQVAMDGGWNLEKWQTTSERADLKGLSFFKTKQVASTIQSWIRLNTGIADSYTQETIVLKALKRAKYENR